MSRERRAVAVPDAVIAIACAAIALALCLWGVGGRSLYNGDDAIYAAFVQEMHKTGDWLHLRFDGEIVHQRPPLYVWLVALSTSLGGMGETAMRMPALLSTAATAALLFWMGRSLVGRLPAAAAGLLYATLALPFLYARTVTSDPTLTLLCLATVAAWRARALRTAGVLLGLSLMTKQIIGGLPLVAVAVTALVDRASLPPPRRLLEAAAIALAVWAPWHAYMLARHGGDFVDGYLGYNVVARGAGSVLADTGPGYYFEILWKKEGPLLLAAVLLGLAHAAWRRREGDLLLAAFPLVVLAGFSAMSTRIDYYLLPAFPFLALLAAAPLERVAAWRPPESAWLAGLAGAALVVASLALHLPQRANAPDPFADLRTLSRRAAELAPAGTPFYVLDELYLSPRVYAAPLATTMIVSDEDAFARYKRMEPLRSAATVIHATPDEVGARLMREPRWLALADRRRAGELPPSIAIHATAGRYILFGKGL